jgi:GR25 family glycosyltransferase involved in LPS biosynthesis
MPAGCGVAGKDKIPVMVINLDRYPDRMARFMAYNTIDGVEIVRMQAVDGEKLDRADLVARNLIAPDLIYSTNSVACSLSHVRCWQRIIESGRPGVVCEDDVALRRDFGRLHEAFAAELARADAIFWSYNFDMHVAYRVPGMGTCSTIYDEGWFNDEARIAEFQAGQVPVALWRPERLWGVACYSVSPRGAARMLDRVMPLRNATVEFPYPTGLKQMSVCSFPTIGIDSDLGLVHVKELDAWVAVPPAAIHVTHNNVSTIDGGNEEARYTVPPQN